MGVLLLVVVARSVPAAGAPPLVFGVLGVIAVVGFWSALPFAFGAAALASAAPADDGGTHEARRGMVTAGAALGALAIVAAFVLCIIGRPPATARTTISDETPSLLLRAASAGGTTRTAGRRDGTFVIGRRRAAG